MPANENQSFFEKLNQWIRSSITIKLVSIGILILLLLIPTAMVTSLISERQFTSQSAVEEVSSKWGNAQTITGPILSVPYKKYYKKDNEIIEETEYAHFLPEDLKIAGTIAPEKRYRGIYEVVVYNAKLNVKGKINAPDFSEFGIEPKNIIWKDAIVSLGITDMRGINDNIKMKWNNSDIKFGPGIGHKDISEAGVSARLNATDSLSQKDKTFSFSFDLNINGSRQLYFIPLGMETNVELSSSWSEPSFDGAFLPKEHTISPSGFNSKWKVLELNRNYPQKWTGAAYQVNESAFGVNLIVPVDHYDKSYRSAKYAILIITLTFMVFFFVEILNKQRIHPFQYILVGLAVCIFYSLLIAISEHLNFNWAYIVSAIAVIAAITLYSRSIFGKKILTVVLSLILLAIYIFIFTIIQLQDYALLMGSIGLFIVLITVMYLSRKINWYNSSAPEQNKE